MRVTKEILDKLIENHNGEKDQVWSRTLKTSRIRERTEVIGVCNYGNLYFAQLFEDGRARVDWIKKQYIGKKYRDVQPEHFEVRDHILDRFRAKVPA